jgi:anti-anti-sigma regulatory factor
MRTSSRGNLIVETLAPGIRAMRFARPDMRQHLDDEGDAATSPLFREIEHAALANLPADGTLVVNLGLVDLIGAAFYRCLLDIRRHLHARHGWLILCGLRPRHQEVFELFRGPEVFTIVSTEVEACRHVRDRQGYMATLRCQNSGRPPHYGGDEPRILAAVAQ